MISFVYSHRKILIIVLVTFVVWHVSTVARKGQTKRWLNRAKSTPGGKTGNTEMTPRWKQTNQQRLGEDEIHGGGNKNRDRRREAKRDTWGEKKKTGKNQSMTVFASNIQPFNWVIDLMRWTSWMRKVKTFPRRDPNCTTKKDVIETQELQWKYSDGSGCTNSFWVCSIFVLRCGSQTGSRIRTGLELQSCLFQEINLYSHSAPVSQRFACELC